MATSTYQPADIRNIALVGHGTCGKTSLAEALLFNSGVTTRLGNTVGGTSVMDFEPEEQKRGGSISTAFAWFDHNGKKINILDTPGDGNFIYDSFTAMRGADAAVVVISCPDKVEVQTERVYHEAANLGIPRFIVINKMDRERADVDAALADIEESFGIKPVPLQVPIGEEHDFGGVVSLMQMKALNYKSDGSGDFSKSDIPAELADEVEAAWENLVETVASTDDDLLEKYLETFELTKEEVQVAFQAALIQGEILPVLYTAASKNIGVHAIADLVAWAVPSPLQRGTVTLHDEGGEEHEHAIGESEPFVAQVIKTFMDEFSGKQTIFRVYSGTVPSDGQVKNLHTGESERLGSVYALRGNTRGDALVQGVCGDVLAVAKLKNTHTGQTLARNVSLRVPQVNYPPPMMEYTITPSGKGDEDKLKVAVERLIDEDPTLSLGYDDLSHKMVLRGMGQAHLDLSADKMKRKFKVGITTDLPAVPYRETIKRKVSHVEGKHKKQTGGAGQFGVCYIDVEPLERGSGFEFVNKIFGGSIPRQFIPSVEKGIVLRAKSGFLAGYPMVDFRVTLTDGKYHPVDSKDVAFQMAGSKGIRAALERSGVRLLEPMYKMEIVVPSDAMGDIMGDVTSRRGRVLGMDTRGRKTVIQAVAPLAEIRRYAPDLRSMTGGQGTFTMEFDSYEPLPNNMVDKVVSESPFRKSDDED